MTKEHLSESERRLIEGLRKSTHQIWLILPDLHRPFHNGKIFNKILQLISDIGTNLYGINLCGDYLDLYTLGSYNADSLGLLRGIDLGFEYEDGNEGLDALESATHKGVKLQYLFGNHEDRYLREVNKGDRAKYGDALKSPVEALKLSERGYEFKTNWKDDFFTLGKHLDIIHGIYTNVHSAKKHLDMTNHSVMFGHSHRIQAHHSGDRASFNIGCLADIKNKVFNYMPRFQKNVWANGFAMVHINDNGEYFAEQVNIWNDSFYARGRIY